MMFESIKRDMIVFKPLSAEQCALYAEKVDPNRLNNYPIVLNKTDIVKIYHECN